MSDRFETEHGNAEPISGDSQKSVSNLKTIFEPPNETSTVITQSQMRDREVTIKSELLPIDPEVALIKEEVLINFYFGKANVPAGDFINANLLNILDKQLLDEQLSRQAAKELVFAYLANYSNWASMAKLHSVKAANKVRFLSFFRISQKLRILKYFKVE